MKSFVSTEMHEAIEAVHYRPAVSIIMPFEPKMGTKKELIHVLDMASDKVEKELMESYSDDLSLLVMRKLKALIKNLNFNTYKKSVALFISPVFEKVLYLDIFVEKKIIIDQSFEMRELVFSKKEILEYLVLQINNRESQIYLGNSATFKKIVSNSSTSEKITGFVDTEGLREIETNKFIRHIDNGLGIILKSYPIPLFVMGTERILGHFKKLTKHNGVVIDYIQSNYDDAPMPVLRQRIAPFIINWNKVKQQDLLNQLDAAARKEKLAVGMTDVWRGAMSKKGRLLLVEKNYTYAAERGSSDEIIYKVMEPYNKFSYIKDAVDDVIEKVLENGGDVEFVDEGFLSDYNQIALIQYY